MKNKLFILLAVFLVIIIFIYLNGKVFAWCKASAIDEASYFLSIASDYINVGFLLPVLDLENRSEVDLQKYNDK